MSEPELFDQYLDALRRNPNAAPPSGLDSDTADFIRALAAAERSPAPPQSLQDRIWHKALTLAQTEQDTFRRPSTSPNGQVDQKLTVVKSGEKIQIEPDDSDSPPQDTTYPAEAPSTRPPTSRHLWQYTVTIAAAILLIILLGGLLIQMANRSPRDGYPLSENLGTETPTVQPTTPAPMCEWNKDYFTRGMLSIKAGDYPAASADFNCAITNDPNDYVSYLWRGGLAALDGDYDHLGNDLYAFYTHRTGSTDALRLEVVKAIPELSAAIGAHPDDPTPYLLRGLAYIVADLQLSALPDFEQLIELRPNNAAGYLFRWSVNQSAANDVLDNGLAQGEALAPDSILVDWIRWVNLDQANSERDRPFFESAAERDPGHRFAYGALGMADAYLGDSEAASQAFYQHIQNNQTKSVDGDALVIGRKQTVQVSAGNVYRMPFEARAGQKLNITTNRADRAILWAFPVTAVLLNPHDELMTVPYRVQSDYGNTNILMVGAEIPADGTYTLLISPNYSGQIAITLSEAK